MDREPKYLTKNAKEGDIYYFVIDQRYYFLKIVKIVKDKTLFEYFVVIFEKSYSKLPENNDDVDFRNIYKIKYKPKKHLLYILYTTETSELKIDRFDGAYRYKDKYDFHYWAKENDKNEYNPKIILDSSDTLHFGEVKPTDENGIMLFAESAKIGYLFDRIENDIKHKNKKIQKISPKYFPHWTDDVEVDIIIKMEKLFDKYLDECKKIDVEKALKKCVKSINKLNEKEYFIYTIEAEDIFDKIFEITKQYPVDESVVEKIIEENREWQMDMI